MSKADTLQADIDKVQASVKRAKNPITQEQADRQIELLKTEVELEKENEKLTGKGLRWLAGLTRGKSSQVIKWQAFDTDSPETLPSDPSEFSKLTGISGAKAVTKFLIDGFNELQYSNASDPANEYLDASWPDELKTAFRVSLKAMSAALEQDMAETAKDIKPGFDKKFAAMQSA